MVTVDYYFREGGGREGKRMLELHLTATDPIWMCLFSLCLCLLTYKMKGWL